MKSKNILLILLLSIVTTKIFAVTNKTFFMPNTKGQELIINQTQTNNFMRAYIKGNLNENFFMSGSIFYEESCSAGGLSKYFMPNGKTELIVRGHKAAEDSGAPDIYAEWLGIPSSVDMDEGDDHTFSSRFTISPEIKRWGTNFFVYKKIHKHFWLSVLVPFANVATNARLKESGINGNRSEGLIPTDNAGAPWALYYEEPLNVTQALSHPLMKYGKIDNIKHQKAGIADINLRLGVNKKYADKYLFDFYTQAIIPTADKPTAEYLFEPIVGNGHHFGVGCGLKFSTEFKNFTFLTNFDYLYLFQGTEKRSFDLHNRPWSRYMAATLGLPRTRPERLINFLTKDFKVSPGSHFNALFSIDYSRDKFHFEFGTNIECRSSENVSLKDGWSEGVAIAYYGDDPSGLYPVDPVQLTYNKSHSKAKIDSSMIIGTNNGDANFTPIKNSDLNLNSARSLNSLSINPYLNIGFDGKFISNLFNISSGIFYKANSNNKSLGSFGFWLNGTISI